MAGYTPVFSSVLDGTLHGKWPHSGLWLCLLSQCDRNGHIDQVPRLLASKIGISEEMLMQCIHDFMQPDPGSRTGDLEGRRLELIDPVNRNWGWRVINHGIYRERARKQSYDAERTQSGKDAERKRQERERRAAEARPDTSREGTGKPHLSTAPPSSTPQPQNERNPDKQAVPRSPDASREVPLSDSESNSTKERGKRKPIATRWPEKFALDSAMREQAVTKYPDCDPDAIFEQFAAYHGSKGTLMVDWRCAWITWLSNAGKFGYPKKKSLRWM